MLRATRGWVIWKVRTSVIGKERSISSEVSQKKKKEKRESLDEKVTEKDEESRTEKETGNKVKIEDDENIDQQESAAKGT